MAKIDLGSVISTAISSLPEIIAVIKGNHATANPGAPPLTDEQVKAALQSAVTQSLAKDDEIEADVHRRNPST